MGIAVDTLWGGRGGSRRLDVFRKKGWLPGVDVETHGWTDRARICTSLLPPPFFHNNPQQLCVSRLTEAVLARVAQEMNVSVDAVKSLTPGRERRNRHDDITVVVVFFEEERKVCLWISVCMELAAASLLSLRSCGPLA